MWAIIIPKTLKKMSMNKRTKVIFTCSNICTTPADAFSWAAHSKDKTFVIGASRGKLYNLAKL